MNIGSVTIDRGTWVWQQARQFDKTLVSAGCIGAGTIKMAVGAKPVIIMGHDGGPAVKIAASHALLNAWEAVIENLINNAAPSSWTDDAGRTGSSLVIRSYRRQGKRIVMSTGYVWQPFYIEAEELSGA